MDGGASLDPDASIAFVTYRDRENKINCDMIEQFFLQCLS